MQQATWLKGRNSMCIFAVGQALVPTQEEKTICALVERIYLIIVSREGNHARFELLSKIFESFNVMGYIPPPVCLWACKERHNLCMNRASLDRQSLDCVSWTSTTPFFLRSAEKCQLPLNFGNLLKVLLPWTLLIHYTSLRILLN